LFQNSSINIWIYYSISIWYSENLLEIYVYLLMNLPYESTLVHRGFQANPENEISFISFVIQSTISESECQEPPIAQLWLWASNNFWLYIKWYTNTIKKSELDGKLLQTFVLTYAHWKKKDEE